MRRFLAAQLVCLSCATAALSSDSGVAAFTRGAERLAAKHWDDAERDFTAATRDLGPLPDILALRGIARFHLGRHDDAVEDLDAAIDGDTRYLSRALYYQGMALSAAGRAREASSAFARLLAEHPGSPEAQRASMEATPPPESHTGVAALLKSDALLSIAVGFDSNATRTLDLPGSAAESGDWHTSLLASGRSALGRHTALRAAALARAYRELNAYDFASVALAAELRSQPSAPSTFTAIVNGSQSWLQGEPFQTRIGCSVRLHQPSEHRLTYEVDATCDALTHGDAYAELDGRELGAAARVRSRRNGLQPGAQVRTRNTRAATTHLGYAESEIAFTARYLTPSSRLVVDSKLGFGSRTYADINPSHTALRVDEYWSVESSALWRMRPSLLFRAEISYAPQTSTVSGQSYEHFTSSLGLVWLF